MRTLVVTSAVLVVLNVLIFGQVYSFDFIGYDDPTLIVENPSIHLGLSAAGIAEAFKPYYANWIPLTMLSYHVDYAVGGLDPAGYHVTNLVLHILNTLLVLWLFHYLSGRVVASIFLALVFAVHPVHIESIAWVAERKGLLSTLFTLGAMGLYAGYVRESRWSYYALTLAACACALMAKPMAVTIPAVLLLMDAWPLDRFKAGNVLTRENARMLGRCLLEKAPMFGMALVATVVTMGAQSEAGSVSTLEQVTMGMRMSNVLQGYGAYLAHFVWPVDLIPFYPHQGDALAAWIPVVSAIGLATITLACLVYARSRPYLLWGWAFYLVTLLPVIGIIQVGAQAYADRYAYIPLLGIGVMVIFLLDDITVDRRQLRVGLACAAALLLAITSGYSWIAANRWTNDLRLFQHTVRVDADNLVAHTILGRAYYEREEYGLATEHLGRALTIKANHRPALDAMGDTIIRTESDRLHGLAGSIDTTNEPVDEIKGNIGAGLIMKEDYESAEPILRSALEFNSRNAVVMTNLAITVYHLGDEAEARSLVDKAIALDPNYGNALRFRDRVLNDPN